MRSGLLLPQGADEGLETLHLGLQPRFRLRAPQGLLHRPRLHVAQARAQLLDCPLLLVRRSQSESVQPTEDSETVGNQKHHL